MKILVACEFFGTVREELLKRCHDAMSCDLLPSDLPRPHYQGDAVNQGGLNLQGCDIQSFESFLYA